MVQPKFIYSVQAFPGHYVSDVKADGLICEQDFFHFYIEFEGSISTVVAVVGCGLVASISSKPNPEYVEPGEEAGRIPFPAVEPQKNVVDDSKLIEYEEF